jgi:hypothetical protein
MRRARSGGDDPMQDDHTIFWYILEWVHGHESRERRQLANPGQHQHRSRMIEHRLEPAELMPLTSTKAEGICDFAPSIKSAQEPTSFTFPPWGNDADLTRWIPTRSAATVTDADTRLCTGEVRRLASRLCRGRHRSFSELIGSSRTRLPVAWNTAEDAARARAGRSTVDRVDHAQLGWSLQNAAQHFQTPVDHPHAPPVFRQRPCHHTSSIARRSCDDVQTVLVLDFEGHLKIPVVEINTFANYEKLPEC